MMSLKLVSTLLLATLLAACASKVPISETEPVQKAASANSITAPKAPKKTALIAGKFHCELNNRVDVSVSAQHPDVISVGWKGRSYSLTAVGTTTGALRYEDAASGHVWIQIPAKSMLLNAKAGQQLANECHIR